MLKNTILGLAVALCVGSGQFVRAQSSDGDSLIVAPSRAQAPLVPDVSAVDLNGRTWNLRSLRGHPVILSLFATWCPPCREEMKDFGELQRKLGPSGLVILAVSKEDTATLASYARNSGDGVPLLTDSNVIATMGTGAYPTNYFIGRDGRILARTVGASPAYTRLLTKLAQNELAPSQPSKSSPAPSAGSRRVTSEAPRQSSQSTRASSSQLRSQASIAIRNANKKAARKKGRASKSKPASDDGVLLLSNSGSRILR